MFLPVVRHPLWGGERLVLRLLSLPLVTRIPDFFLLTHMRDLLCAIELIGGWRVASSCQATRHLKNDRSSLKSNVSHASTLVSATSIATSLTTASRSVVLLRGSRVISSAPAAQVMDCAARFGAYAHEAPSGNGDTTSAAI
jgi:hypothetical protein